jgi:hypothetical protein
MHFPNTSVPCEFELQGVQSEQNIRSCRHIKHSLTFNQSVKDICLSFIGTSLKNKLINFVDVNN